MLEAKDYPTTALLMQAAIASSMRKKGVKVNKSDMKFYYHGGNMISAEKDLPTLDQVYMTRDMGSDAADMDRRLINNWHDTALLPPEDDDETIFSPPHILALFAKPPNKDYDDYNYNQAHKRMKRWKSYHSTGIYAIQIDRYEENDADKEKKEKPAKKLPVDEKAAKKDLQELIDIQKLMVEEASQSIHIHKLSAVIMSLGRSLGMGDVTPEELSAKLTSENGLSNTFSYDDVILVASKIEATSKSGFTKVNVTRDMLEEAMAYDENDDIVIKEDWNEETTKILGYQVKHTRSGDVYDGVVHQATIDRKRERWVMEAIELLTKIVQSDRWICTIQNIDRAESHNWKEDLYIALIPKTELDQLGMSDYTPRQPRNENEENKSEETGDESDGYDT